MGNSCHSNTACYLGSWENGTHWCCPGKLETQAAERQKIKHNEPQGLGVGCAMFKIKTKDNGWEQIIVMYAKKRIKDLNLISRAISWVGNGSSLILVVCESRKMGPSFKAKPEGSHVRCEV